MSAPNPFVDVPVDNAQPYGDMLIDVDDALIKALDDALIGGMLLPESRFELQCVRLAAARTRRLALESRS